MTTTDHQRRPAVIWDMGGIMYRYFTEVVLDMASERGWDLGGMPLGPTGPIHDPDYEAMTSGAIDEAAYLAIIHERLHGRGIDIHIPSEIHWPDQARTGTWRLIAAIADAGHPQALLTNDASKWIGPQWWETWEPARWFDAMVDVTTIGARKPAPEPYLAGARALGISPQECLFVDDMVVNCDGAEAVGMASHHVDVRDVDGALDRLARRLGVAGPVTADRAGSGHGGPNPQDR